MSRTKRKPTLSQRIQDNYESSDQRLAAGQWRCLICGDPSRDATHQVPEVGPFIGKRIGEDELERAARKRLEQKEGCISWPLAGFSLCGRTKIIGAAGDAPTERRLELLGFRK